MDKISLYNYNIFDDNKKTIIAFMLEHSINKNTYPVTTRYFYNTLNILNKNFNIILITKNTSNKYINIALNNEITKNFIHLVFDDKYRKYYNSKAKDMNKQQCIDYILDSIKELENEYPKLCKSFIATINSSNVLPGYNHNIELISNGDINLLNKQINASNLYNTRFKQYTLIGHTGYITKNIGFGLTFLSYLMKHYNNMYHYCFSHSTNTLWILYNPIYNKMTNNLKNFYFVKQFKENRNFNSFPIVELQDCLNNPLNIQSIDSYESILNNKSIDFLFGGLFPENIPQRIKAWYKYINNLNMSNFIIRSQIDNKWKIDNKKLNINIDNNDSQFKIDIKNFKNLKPTLNYDDYNNELSKSMFTLIIETYGGMYDNLTLRFLSSIYFGCIPLIAEEYDTNNLQIPQYLRNKLLVKSSQDIVKKINYYKNNLNTYKNLFYELWNYYLNKNVFNINYYENKFKEDYFKEIY